MVDICQRAMVHRTTFYAHFDDKLALLRYAVDELQKYFEPVDPSLDPRTGPRREYFMVLALIRWWLSSGADVPDEVLLRHVEHFIPQPELPV